VDCHLLTFLSSFGFIKFHNFEDAENCIRGFHYLGYEVSFARVSLTMLFLVVTVLLTCGRNPSTQS
jgi:hypothetical protein